MRSAATLLLSVPCHIFNFGSRALHVSAQPRIWNTFPPSVRDCKSLTDFRRNLKVYCFQSAFTTPSQSSHKCALVLSRSWRYIYHVLTYLLTEWVQKLSLTVHCAGFSGVFCPRNLLPRILLRIPPSAHHQHKCSSRSRHQSGHPQR